MGVGWEGIEDEREYTAIREKIEPHGEINDSWVINCMSDKRVRKGINRRESKLPGKGGNSN